MAMPSGMFSFEALSMTFQPYLRKSYWSKARKDNDHYQVKWQGMVFDFEYIRFGAKDD